MEHRSFAPDIVVPNDDYACGNKRAGELAPDVAPEELRQEKQVGGPVNCSDSELCTFLLALEAGFLPTYYSDTNQSVQLKSMSIASRSYQHGKKTVVFHGSPSLQMSSNLTERCGAELLTWFLAVSHARTSAPQEQGAGFLGDALGFGMKCLGSLARYDRDSCSWRTLHESLLGDSTEFSGTWPAWGLMRDGELLALQTPEGFTPGNVCGLWLTPTVEDFKRRGNAAAWEEYITTKRETCARLRNQAQPEHGEGYLTPEFAESLMWLPIGWSAAQPLATDRFQQWRQWHGGF